MPFRYLVALGLVISLLACGRVSAENWPQWRGPAGTGVSGETNLPAKFSATEGVAWKLALPGPSGATPAVWDDRIFLTSVAENGSDLLLICVSTAGEKLWERQVSSGNRDVRGDEGNTAANSPCTDGKYVWSMMANGALGCYDFDGKQVWHVDLPERYGKLQIAFGMTSTPVLDGDRLYIQLIHGEGKPATQEARIVALNKNTGEEIWSTNRPSDAIDECEHSYASPVLYRYGGHEFLLSHGADYIIAHSLVDGREIWRCGGLNPKGGNYNPTLRFVASPTVAEGLIVVPSAKNGIVLGLKPGGQGDVSAQPDMLLWSLPNSTPDVPTPVIHEGLVYICRENGNLACIDAKSGEQIYLETTHRHRHRASPVLADGKLYLSSRDGMISVVRSGRKFELLSQNQLDEIASSPAIANGKIYFRTAKTLYAFGN